METQDPVSKSKPVRYLGLAFAAMVALQGYLSTIDGIPKWVLLVIGGVIIVGTAVGVGQTEARTVPFKNVAARVVDETGLTLAGPAAEPTAGLKVGDAVQVTTLPAN